jgi:hypothetical protein
MLSREGLSKPHTLNTFFAARPKWTALGTRRTTGEYTRLAHCPQCGCDRLVVRGHKLVLDPRGVVFPSPVPALDCDDCGRLYAVDEIWDRRLELGSKPISHLVSEREGGRAAQA